MRLRLASSIGAADNRPAEEIAGIAPASRPAESTSRQIFGVSDVSFRVRGVRSAASGGHSSVLALAI